VAENQHQYAGGGDPGTDAAESASDQMLTVGAQPGEQRARRDQEYQRARARMIVSGIARELWGSITTPHE